MLFGGSGIPPFSSGSPTQQWAPPSNYKQTNGTAVLFVGRECWEVACHLWQDSAYGQSFFYFHHKNVNCSYRKYHDRVAHAASPYSKNCMFLGHKEVPDNTTVFGSTFVPQRPLADFKLAAPYTLGFLHDDRSTTLAADVDAAVELFAAKGHTLASDRVFVVDPKRLLQPRAGLIQSPIAFLATGLPDIGHPWKDMDKLFVDPPVPNWGRSRMRVGIVLEMPNSGEAPTTAFRDFLGGEKTDSIVLQDGQYVVGLCLARMGEVEYVIAPFVEGRSIDLALSEMGASRQRFACDKVVVVSAEPTKYKKHPITTVSTPDQFIWAANIAADVLPFGAKMALHDIFRSILGRQYEQARNKETATHELLTGKDSPSEFFAIPGKDTGNEGPRSEWPQGSNLRQKNVPLVPEGAGRQLSEIIENIQGSMVKNYLSIVGFRGQSVLGTATNNDLAKVESRNPEPAPAEAEPESAKLQSSEPGPDAQIVRVTDPMLEPSNAQVMGSETETPVVRVVEPETEAANTQVMEPETETPIVRVVEPEAVNTQVMEPETETPIVRVVEPEAVNIEVAEPEPEAAPVQVVETGPEATIVEVVETRPSPVAVSAVMHDGGSETTIAQNAEPEHMDAIFIAVEDAMCTAAPENPVFKKVSEKRGTTSTSDDEYQPGTKRKKKGFQGGSKRKRTESPKKEKAEKQPERSYNLRPRKKRT